ncbi:MAG TPA: Clp protease N-terminal domain-containing protein [Drouetiella sp.]|jgi:ArsR family transcriptional regulator, arsenate/arsenite/antimonite-responsive transcriptional repressor / arsenate reductase (thioredoxin)
MFSRAMSRGQFGVEENSYTSQTSGTGSFGSSVLKPGQESGTDRRNQHLENAIRYAKEESLRLGHKFVGSEQLLIGILRQDKAVAAMVLNSLGVSTDKARREMKNIIGYGAGMGEIAEEDLHSTLLFRRIIETAFEISRRFRSEEVRTEHILLALISNERGVALRILEILNVDLNRLLFLINEVDK